MPVSLSRVVGFRALHRFYRPDWSDDRNRDTFGPLSDAPGHAHDYQCVVTVTGPLEPLQGMVMDLVELDRILQEEVVGRFDGRHLNLDVPEFAYGRMLPTCEALATHVYGRVAARLPSGVALERVRVAEDPTLYGDCTASA
jgi:6-pyruvoyltetrahydropterin/6-carboxytetrahydropterin synthase